MTTIPYDPWLSDQSFPDRSHVYEVTFTYLHCFYRCSTYLRCTTSLSKFDSIIFITYSTILRQHKRRVPCLTAHKVMRTMSCHNLLKLFFLPSSLIMHVRTSCKTSWTISFHVFLDPCHALLLYSAHVSEVQGHKQHPIS